MINAIYGWQTNWFQPISDLFTAANLPLLLLFGSGILAVSLLLLALTHWGHSRPVWKCVVLSVVAHILLMGYAYGTRLIWDTQPKIKETAEADFESLQVTLVDDVQDDETTQVETDQLAPSDLPTSGMDLPEIAPLMRPEIDSEVVVEVPEPSFIPTEAPLAPANIPLPIAESFEAAPRLSRQQEMELLPEARIIEPEPIGEPGKQEANGFEGPEMAFNGDLQRQKIHSQLDQPNPRSFDARQPQTDPLSAPRPSDLVKGRRLPQPELAPRLDDLTSMRPMPRPVSNNDGKSDLRVLRRTRRIGDGQPVPKIYSLRNPADRLRIARQRGGSLETESAVDAALQWLATNQEEDGSWDPTRSGAGREDRIFGHNRNGAGAQADTGITGLATLAFLAAGHTHLEGDYRSVVKKSLQFLIKQQRSNGDLSGEARLFAKMYCHSMSLLALGEALAMTGDQNLYSAVSRGVDFSQFAQNRKDGGWRYQPGDTGDMSQFGWQVLALKSAKLGGVPVTNDTMKRMRSFLKSCSSGVGGGLASYRPSQGPTTSMTAEALLCRFFLEKQVSPLTLREAQRQISTELPNDKQVNLYYWYYGTLAMYHGGGKGWENWNRELKATLLPMQIREGQGRGSFPANGIWGGYGGTVYSTAMATLNLEVYYRYLPLYQELAEKPSFDANPLR